MSQHCWMFLWSLLSFLTKRKMNKTSFTQRNQFRVVWKLQESCKFFWMDWWRLQFAMFGRFERFIFFGVLLFNLSKQMSISICTTLSSHFTKSISYAHESICYNFFNLHIFTLWCQVCKIFIISLLTISWCCLSVSQKSPLNTMFMFIIIVCLI